MSEQAGERVAPLDVSQFVGQHRAQLLFRPLVPCGRQEDLRRNQPGRQGRGEQRRFVNRCALAGDPCARAQDALNREPSREEPHKKDQDPRRIRHHDDGGPPWPVRLRRGWRQERPGPVRRGCRCSLRSRLRRVGGRLVADGPHRGQARLPPAARTAAPASLAWRTAPPSRPRAATNWNEPGPP